MEINERTEILIRERIAKLNENKARVDFKKDVSRLTLQKNYDLHVVEENLAELFSIHAIIVDKVKKLKILIPNIDEQTVLCANYLIYGKVLQTWKAIFILASNGYYFDTMDLVRSIGENLDLIKTLCLDKENKHIKKWFKGEIIDHSVAREIGSEFIKKNMPEWLTQSKVDPYRMATDVYRIMSKYTHCSYAAILDCIDVYNYDFDWKGYAGAHYMAHNIHVLKSAMTSSLVALKMIFMELKDWTEYKNIDVILNNFSGTVGEEGWKNLC